jgi:hypothetical protein
MDFLATAEAGLAGLFLASFLAATLLFLGMFAGALSLARWGTRFTCKDCGWEGEWEGTICPECGARN